MAKTIYFLALALTAGHHDIRDFENLSAGQLAQKLYFSRWFMDLPTTQKSVYFTKLNSMCISHRNEHVQMVVLLVPDNRTTINVAP